MTTTEATRTPAAPVPPIDTHGEMGTACKLLKRFRAALAEEFPDQVDESGWEWRKWVAASLLSGIEAQNLPLDIERH